MTHIDISCHEFLSCVALLSKAEHNYLTALSATVDLKTRDGYNRVNKAKLQKNKQWFAREELPVLIEKELLPVGLLP